MAKSIITAEELRILYSYDPIAGTLARRRSEEPDIHGRPLGSINPRGYVMHTIKGVCYRVHRLAWLYMYGKWPTEGLDHINGIRSDNRIENLRECNQSQNLQNQRKAAGRTGLIGAQFERRTGTWRAQITLNKVQTQLGRFNTEAEAHNAYVEAKRRLHPFGQL